MNSASEVLQVVNCRQLEEADHGDDVWVPVRVREEEEVTCDGEGVTCGDGGEEGGYGGDDGEEGEECGGHDEEEEPHVEKGRA